MLLGQDVCAGIETLAKIPPIRITEIALLPLILLLLLPCSPFLCFPFPSLHVVIASLYFSTLSLSLPFYNKHLKTMDCLFSSGSAMLEQWSRSSSRAEPSLTREASLCSQTRFLPSQATCPRKPKTLLPMGPSQSALLLTFFPSTLGQRPPMGLYSVLSSSSVSRGIYMQCLRA